MATITVSAFRWVPPFAQGLVRDLRVRWALEEAGVRYKERLIGPEDQRSESYRRLQPFGQVPAYEEDGLVLFESGAIVLHIAEHYQGLLPDDAKARARAITWMFAALTTMEPPIVDREVARLLERDETWYEQRLPMVEERIRKRLSELSGHLGDADWLDGKFSAGDLLMVSVLLRLKSSGLLDEYRNLSAYVARGEARPAYKRAFEAQLAVFTAASTG